MRLKRAFDVVVATLGLIATSPLLLLISVAVKATSRGPVLYRTIRVGRLGEPFVMHKFRTMAHAPHPVGPRITARGDVRVTKIGRWLRVTKLDELPQLYDVLRGEMSIVGPRPEDPHYVSLYSEDQRTVLSVRPGITGPTATRYRHEEVLLASAADPEKVYVTEIMPAKLAIDLEYVRSRTFIGDLRVLLATVSEVFRRQDNDGARLT